MWGGQSRHGSALIFSQNCGFVTSDYFQRQDSVQASPTEYGLLPALPGAKNEKEIEGLCQTQSLLAISAALAKRARDRFGAFVLKRAPAYGLTIFSEFSQSLREF